MALMAPLWSLTTWDVLNDESYLYFPVQIPEEEVLLAYETQPSSPGHCGNAKDRHIQSLLDCVVSTEAPCPQRPGLCSPVSLSVQFQVRVDPRNTNHRDYHMA